MAVPAPLSNNPQNFKTPILPKAVVSNPRPLLSEEPGPTFVAVVRKTKANKPILRRKE
jgi:hypothetical protein